MIKFLLKYILLYFEPIRIGFTPDTVSFKSFELNSDHLTIAFIFLNYLREIKKISWWFLWWQDFLFWPYPVK
jgi:hypothetical protein